jgi:hypothetical protein
MALRWYVMPAETVVTAHGQTLRPQFLDTILGTDASGAVLGLWGWLPINDDWAIGWVDLTAGQHTTYNADAGVLFLTADLNALLTAGQVSGVQTRLSNKNLPSAWVDVTDTWLQVIKRIYGFVQCIQRYFGETRQSINLGVPVTTLVSSLSQAVQGKLDVVASTFPGGALPAVDHANDTMETLLMRWSDELINRPVFVNGIQL